MIIAQGHDLEQHFGTNTLFSNLNFAIPAQGRIGLVGANGVGKTTLLKIMTGELTPSHGAFTVNKNIHIGYVAQENGLNDQETIWSEMQTVFQDLINQGKQIADLENQIARHPQDKGLLKRYDALSFSFQQNGGFSYQAEIKSLLNGFDFPEKTWSKQIKTLSGGEKTRLSLAKLLLKKPELLLLDEPTNYLDLDTLDWLENFLKTYPGAILLVSHDQYFLDHLTNQIFELRFGQLNIFKGNYSQYLAQRDLQDRQQQTAYEKQQAEIKKDEIFIQKNIVRATTTKRAQSRRKRLDKIERLTPPKHSHSLRINFKIKRRSGKEVLIAKHLTIGYPERTMVHDLDFQVNQQDRVAIIGPNGTGKSTLLKTIMKRLPQKGGQLKYGASLDIGYYDQELQGLDYDKTVIATIWDRYPTMLEKDIRSLLASFLFTAKDIDKIVGTLSGGQKARLTLTLLALEQNNLLIMDEPTNHLDLSAKRVLQEALKTYPGTLIFVSHDRYFIDQLANKMLVINNGQGHFLTGNYADYLEKKQKQAATVKSPAASNQENTEQNSGKLSYEAQKKHDSQKRKLKRQAEKAEKEIEDLEAEQKKIQLQMSDPEIAADFEKLAPLQENLEALQKQLRAAESNWDNALNELDHF